MQEERTRTSKSSGVLMVVCRITLWACGAMGVVQEAAVAHFVTEAPITRRRVVCVLPRREVLQPSRVKGFL